MEIYELYGQCYIGGEYDSWLVGTYAYKDVAEVDKAKIESGQVYDYKVPFDAYRISYLVKALSIYTESQFED